VVPETRATLIQEIALPLVSSTVKVLRPQNVGLPKEVYHESEASVMSCVTELPSSTVMAETVGELSVVVVQGLMIVMVNSTLSAALAGANEVAPPDALLLMATVFYTLTV
jgi:hypothetical protein